MANIKKIEIEDNRISTSPIEVEVGPTMPGPKGDKGDPAEVYYSTSEPDPDIGGEGALWARYVG